MYPEITLEQARQQPGDLPAWNNAGEAIARGIYEGASILGEVGSSVVAEALPAGGQGKTDWRQWWDENITAPATASRQKSQERAITYGGASNTLHDIARIGSEAIFGPATVAAAETAIQGAMAVDQGKSGGEAAAIGVVRGVGTGLLAAVPVVAPILRGFGPAIVQRIMSGAAGSILGGVALAGADKATLATLGYDKEAARTAVLSGDSIMANGVLGVLFGLLAHGRAALTARKVGLPLSVVDDAMSVSLRDVGRQAAQAGAKTPLEAAKRLDEFNGRLDATTEGAVPDGKDGLVQPDEALARANKADVSPPTVEAAAKAAEATAVGDAITPEELAAEYPQVGMGKLAKEHGASVRAMAAEPLPKPPKETVPASTALAEKALKDLRQNIVKLGGIDQAEIRDITGEGNATRAGGWTRRLFTKSGVGLDTLRERLVEMGYLPHDTTDVTGDAERIRELVRAAVEGRAADVMPPQTAMEHAQLLAEERAKEVGIEDFDPDAMAQAYHDYAQEGHPAGPAEPARLTAPEAVAVAEVEQAMRKDEAAVEAAAIKHGDDDVAFMAEVRRINGKATGNEGAAAATTGETVPPAQAAFPKNLTIPDAAGNPVNANEHIAALQAEAARDVTPELEAVRQCILAKLAGAL